MTIPVWMLPASTTWTIVLLIGSVGVYRWSRILTRRAQVREFQADRIKGKD